MIHNVEKMKETSFPAEGAKAPSGSKAKRENDVSDNRISQKGKMSSIMIKSRGKNAIIPDLLPIS